MTMKERAPEMESWLRTKFPEDRLSVRPYGRSLTIAAVLADGNLDPLVRIREARPGFFDLLYMRHTGQWEEIPPLSGRWDQVLQALDEDPVGLFWIGLGSRG